MAAIEPGAFCLPSLFDSPKRATEGDEDGEGSPIESDAFSLPSSFVESSVTIGRPSTLLSKSNVGANRSLSDMVGVLDPDGCDDEIEKQVRRDEDANRNGNIRNRKRSREEEEEKADSGDEDEENVHGRVPDNLNFDAPRKKVKYGRRKVARPRDAMPGYRRNRGGGGGGSRKFGRGGGGRFAGRGGYSNVGKRHLDRGTTKKAYYRG